jgi:hypothetical protein
MVGLVATAVQQELVAVAGIRKLEAREVTMVRAAAVVGLMTLTAAAMVAWAVSAAMVVRETMLERRARGEKVE